MVKFFQHTYKYEYPWGSVALAHWFRYPNPFASHVLSVDVIDRYVDQEGALRTTRLIVKRGGLSMLPKWGRSLVTSPVAFVVEESIVNPRTQTMVTLTKNITHERVLQIEQRETFRADPKDAGCTQVTTEARIVSKFGWGMTERVEGFGLSKFADSTAKSRKGMAHVLQMLREKRGQFMSAASPSASVRHLREGHVG